MNKLLSTIELESYIKEKYLKKLNDYLNEDLELEGVYFKIGHDNSPEGIYVYTDKDGYHYLYTEKGKIRKHEITNKIFGIAYWVIDDRIFSVALSYATNNREAGKDFRRKLFEKEKEIWSVLDVKGYNEKCLDIEKILEENPFMDEV